MSNDYKITEKSNKITGEKLIEASILNLYSKATTANPTETANNDDNSSLFTFNRLKTYSINTQNKNLFHFFDNNGNNLSPKMSPKIKKSISPKRNSQQVLSYAEPTRVTDEKLITQIRKILNSHFLFMEMSDIIKSYMVGNFLIYKFKSNTIIYEEGAFGTMFFIVSEGKVVSTTREEPNNKKIIQNFEFFGESCLFSNCKRDSTVKTLTNVTLLVLDGNIFRECLHRIADEKYKDRIDFLNSLSFFKPLDNISKLVLSEKMEYAQFSPKETIIQKDDLGTSMFIIKYGCVSCQINGKQIRKLSEKEYFGQNALLFDVKRTMDVIAIENTVCYKITKDDLLDMFADEYKTKIIFTLFKSIIQTHEILRDIFIDSIIDKLFTCFKVQIYKENESIVEKNGINKKVVIVLDGNIIDSRTGEVIAMRNGVIGYEIIYDKDKTINTFLKAKPDCISLECDIKKLNEILMVVFSSDKKYDNNNRLNPIKLLSRIGKLQKSFLFQHLSKVTIEKIVFKMKKMVFSQGEMIVAENSKGSTFFMISKGRVRVSKKGKILRDLESGNCFGEKALLSCDTIRTATVIAIDTKVVCYVLSKEDFDLIMDDENTKNYLLRKIALQDEDISLESLKTVQFLGKGKFGNVYLVHNGENIYAIKSVSRLSVNRQKMLAQYFINERRVMLTLDHPFIVKLVKTLKNNLFCFFLIEFVNGMSLDEHLIRNKRENLICNIKEMMFYVTSLLLIIDYLHKKYIAHRDIKPANVMIDGNGYIKLIDFGTAKVLKDYTSTVIGTPHYIAPEILKGKGYSMACDYWSVGICAYEMFYGMYPFGNKATDILEIYKEIINKKVLFPTILGNTYNEVNLTISKLLSKKVENRMCSLTLIKKEKLFEGFKWDELIDFKLSPPFKPKQIEIEPLNTYKEKFETRVHRDFFDKSNFTYQVDNAQNGHFKNYDITWAYEF